MNSKLEEVVENQETSIARIIANVTSYCVIDNGMNSAITSTFDPGTTSALCKTLNNILIYCARSVVRDIDPFDDLQFLRVKTKNCEYLIAPEKDFTIIVQQN